MNERIPIDYAALVLSEILLEKGLINRATFNEIEQKLNTADLHISQETPNRI